MGVVVGDGDGGKGGVGSTGGGSGGVALAYVYLDYARKEMHNAAAVVASLLRQLAAQKTPLPAAVVNFHASVHKAYDARPVYANDHAAAISLVAREFEQVFVVVDALDEFPEGKERKELMGLLTSLAQSSVKLFVTSKAFLRRRLPPVKRKIVVKSLENTRRETDIRPDGQTD